MASAQSLTGYLIRDGPFPFPASLDPFSTKIISPLSDEYVPLQPGPGDDVVQLEYLDENISQQRFHRRFYLLIIVSAANSLSIKSESL